MISFINVKDKEESDILLRISGAAPILHLASSSILFLYQTIGKELDILYSSYYGKLFTALSHLIINLTFWCKYSCQ
jgi:hypothetical protein